MDPETRYRLVMCLMFKLTYTADENIESALRWFTEPFFDGATPFQRIARGEGVQVFAWLTGEAWS